MVQLFGEDRDGLPDVFASLSSMQSELSSLRGGIEDEIRKKVQDKFHESRMYSQFKDHFLDTITQSVYKAIDLQFKPRFDVAEKSLNDFRSKVIQDSGKLLKLETKLDDMNRSTLLDKVPNISGIDTSARDLVNLGENVIDRLNSFMGICFGDFTKP